MLKSKPPGFFMWVLQMVLFCPFWCAEITVYHSLWPTPKTSDILGRVHVPIPTWQINEAKNFQLWDWPLIIQLTGNRAVIQNQAWARNPGALSTIQVQLDKAHFINSVLLLAEHIGLPWSSTSFECACQCRGHGFDPWSGKIPHVVGHINPHARATEPVCCNYWSLHTQSLFSATREATAKRRPCTTTRE